MIDPDGVRKKALRRYPDVLRQALAETRAGAPGAPGDSTPPPAPLFPMEIPADRGRSTDPFAQRRMGVEQLFAASKNATGTGYSLRFKEVNTRNEGRQSVVDRVFFESREDYLDFLGKRGEMDAFAADARVVLGRLPQLAPWIAEKPLAFAGYLGEWEALAAVCEYFVLHPRPDCYMRQLPVPVHTKFVEEHQGILQTLLDRLLPVDAVDREAATFEGRYHLKSAEPLVRLRLLDPALASGGLDDLAVPVTALARLSVACRVAFVVENLMPFLTFPGVEGAVCLWGSGFQAGVLGRVPWLASCPVVYWGDIDGAGFEILAALRRALPQTGSLLMDAATYGRYRQFAVADAGQGYGRPADERDAGLTNGERALLAELLSHPSASRLEQERIPHADLVAHLARAGFRLLAP